MLAGRNRGEILDCNSTGTILGDYNVGGGAGNNSTIIERCSSSCLVFGEEKLGGLVGSNMSVFDDNPYGGSRLLRCFATGEVVAADKSRFVGGLVGRNTGAVVKCYADCKVFAGNENQYIGDCLEATSVLSWIAMPMVTSSPETIVLPSVG